MKLLFCYLNSQTVGFHNTELTQKLELSLPLPGHQQKTNSLTFLIKPHAYNCRVNDFSVEWELGRL